MNKNKLVGIGLLVLGVATLFWQLKMLREEGSFYVFGLVSSVFIVLGIASFFINLDDFQYKDENGKKANTSFKDMPGSLKATTVVAAVAGIGQLLFFQFGPIL